MAWSPPVSSPFLGELQPTPGGQHAVILAEWKVGYPCLGSKPPFGSKHAQWGSCQDSELVSPWPPHSVVSEKQSCHMLCGAWHCPGHTESFVKKRLSPSGSYYRGEASRSAGSWGFHPVSPVYFSHQCGWHSISWLRATVTVRWLDACVLSLCFTPSSATHTSTTIT